MATTILNATGTGAVKPTKRKTPIESVGFLSTAPSVTQHSTGKTTINDALVLHLPFNPNSLVFNYILNKVSFDTYGGRVTQILSVKIDTMNIQGDAGSRPNLMAFFIGLKQLQEHQIESKAPLRLFIPRSTPVPEEDTSLTFWVWIQDMQVGFDPSTVVYPYNLTFQVQDSSYPGYSTGPDGYSSYASLSKFITNSSIEALFNKSAAANEIGYTTYGKFGAYYAGLEPAKVYASDGVKGSTTPNASTLKNTITGLGQGSPYYSGY